jgi:hypothetical protein
VDKKCPAVLFIHLHSDSPLANSNEVFIGAQGKNGGKGIKQVSVLFFHPTMFQLQLYADNLVKNVIQAKKETASCNEKKA